MITQQTEKYQRLPGRGRSIIGASSIWMGSDHLLLVKSAWYREEYKRYYLKDIQAIVVAPCARFHVSLLMLLLALAWLLPGVTAAFWPSTVVLMWALGGLALLATWIAISVASSCRCRIQTAVSDDELPSLYRTWTARKFLTRVRPWIEQAQGAIEPGWWMAGTTPAEVPTTAPGQPAPPTPSAMEPATTHSLAADLFVLVLLAGAAIDLLGAHSNSGAWEKTHMAISTVQLIAAVAVLIQQYRGAAIGGFKGLAIAALVLIGVLFYFSSISVALLAATQEPGVTPGALVRFTAGVYQVADGVKILMALIGAAVLLRGASRGRTAIIKD